MSLLNRWLKTLDISKHSPSGPLGSQGTIAAGHEERKIQFGCQDNFEDLEAGNSEMETYTTKKDTIGASATVRYVVIVSGCFTMLLHRADDILTGQAGQVQAGVDLEQLPSLAQE